MKIWTEISSERLAGNYAALQQIAAESSTAKEAKTEPPVAVLAVIKANAYGHGLDPCATILATAGAEWLGVTDAIEGVAVRRVLTEAGIEEARQPQVLVMCGTVALPGEAERMVRHRLTAVVWSLAHLERLAVAARDAGLGHFAVHLEIDSGMTRQGVAPGWELERLLSAIAREPLLELGGVFTHFASTEVANSPQTGAQQKSFEGAIAQVAAFGLKPEWVHVGNSSYLDTGSLDTGSLDTGSLDNGSLQNAIEGDSPLRWLHRVAAQVGARAMVRSGIGLYGYLLPIVSPDEVERRSLASGDIAPVMTWKTRVIGLLEVPAGVAVGYNGTFVTQRPMRLALLPVGYADGLRRELSSSNDQAGGWVMIRGARVLIVGRISMNLTTVDVSAIESVAEGDEAVLLGEGITANDHARMAKTIAYEILCGVRVGPEPVAASQCETASDGRKS